jgi:hypothetical protein
MVETLAELLRGEIPSKEFADRLKLAVQYWNNANPNEQICMTEL